MHPSVQNIGSLTCCFWIKSVLWQFAHATSISSIIYPRCISKIRNLLFQAPLTSFYFSLLKKKTSPITAAIAGRTVGILVLYLVEIQLAAKSKLFQLLLCLHKNLQLYQLCVNYMLHPLGGKDFHN